MKAKARILSDSTLRSLGHTVNRELGKKYQSIYEAAKRKAGCARTRVVKLSIFKMALSDAEHLLSGKNRSIDYLDRNFCGNFSVKNFGIGESIYRLIYKYEDEVIVLEKETQMIQEEIDLLMKNNTNPALSFFASLRVYISRYVLLEDSFTY